MRQHLMVLALLLSIGIASAQTFGSITGAVTDPTGAVVVNAPITVTNTATNVSRSTKTDTAGIYTVPDLVPGPYAVKVTMSGFQPMTSNVPVQVQQAVRVDFSLIVGQTSQTIEVSSSAAALNTENATVGTVIENQRITDLPLNGRDYFQLVALSPNVTYGFAPASQAAGREGGTRSTITISQIGQRATWQNYTLDGVTNTDVDFNLYILLPSVDALQEFKVQSGVYPAEFGREAGQVNVLTKPGTNQFHGAAFEFLRNDALDAKPYDFVPPAPNKTAFRQNQYGFVVGGPVWLPKVFNGKNRLFFMSNFEGFKTRLSSPNYATTLTPAMRTGDFSGLTAFTLLDPNTRAQANGTYSANPFPNNQIPSSRLNNQSTALLQYDPLPNMPSQSATQPFDNYEYNASTPVDKSQVNERIDFNESSNSQWFGRYSWTGESSPTPGITTNDGGTLLTHATQVAVSNTRVFSPTKVNEAQFGYSSINNVIGQQLAGVTNVDAAIGIPIQLPQGNLWGIPQVNLTNGGLTTFGNTTNGPYTISNKYYQWVDNFSWVHGKHSFRFGGEYRRDRFPSYGNEFTRGQFSFNGQYTGNPNTLAGGYSGADFMLGATSTVNMSVTAAQTNYEASEAALYIDDVYKITRKLTLTLGLRWELEQPLEDQNQNEVNPLLRQALPNYELCVPNCGNPNVSNLALHPLYERAGTNGNFWQGVNFIYPAMQVARDGELGSRLINTNWLDFAPRLSIAYSPASNWVIRTGYGVFYSQESKNSVFDMNRTLSGRVTVGPNPQTAPTVNYQNFINTSQLPVQINPAGLTWGASPHFPTTYSMIYVFNVQRQFGSGTTIEAGYNGVLDRHLDYLVNQNQPVPGVSTYYGRAPYPELSYIQYLNADGNGNYNGASIKLTQRLTSGLTVLAAYTYSKSLDEASAIRGTNGSNNDFALENALCRACDYGPSSFNLPHRVVASVLYALPFGQGKHFLNKGGVMDEIVGGWNAI